MAALLAVLLVTGFFLGVLLTCNLRSGPELPTPNR